MISLEKSEIYKVIEVEFFFSCFRFLEKIFFALSFASVIFFVYGFLSGKPFEQAPGAVIFSISAWILMKNLSWFFDDYLKNPERKITLEKALNDKKVNLASFLNLKSAKYLEEAFKEARRKGMMYPDPSTLLYRFVDEKNPRIIFIFSRLFVDFKSLKERLKSCPAEETGREMLESSLE